MRVQRSEDIVDVAESWVTLREVRLVESSSPYHEQIHLVFLGGKVETTAKQPPARADGRVLLAEVDQLIPDRRVLQDVHDRGLQPRAAN